MIKSSLASMWVILLGAAWAGCTDTNIYVNSIEPNIPDRVTISGSVCTDDPAERQFPVRVMFIVDVSGSMSENDPEVHRMTAVQDIINRYVASDNYTFALISFAGEALQLTEDGYTKNLATLNEAVAALAGVQGCVGGWCRNYSAALSLASAIYSGDVLVTNPGMLSRTRYVFIFVANGPPDPLSADQKQKLIDSIEEMRDFGADHGVAEVAFHSVQLDDRPATCTGLPAGEVRYCNTTISCPANCAGTESCQQPQRLCSEDHGVTCDTSDDCVDRCEFIRVCANDVSTICVNDEGCCPTYACDDTFNTAPENDLTAELLQAMSFAGRGEFLSFTLGGQLNFWGLDFDTTQSVFVKKAFLVTNQNVKTLCGEPLADSDGDGLSDLEERCYGELLSGQCRDLLKCNCTLDPWDKITQTGTDTNPVLADTDGDGLGDMLEMLFATVNLDPLRVDLPQACYGLERPYKDRDSDQLNDCEEQLIGTDMSLFDSDRDGYPDQVEFKAGANYLQPDNLRDTDMDGIQNGDELEEHLDPQCNDTSARSGEAYRYKIIDEGLRVVPFTSQPFRIFGAEVTNVSGRSGAGAGGLYFYPVGSTRPDGSTRDRPTMAWRDPADAQHGLEVVIDGNGDYVLYSSCSCVQECAGGCAPGEWCNPSTGTCVPDPCERTSCASTETCDPSQGRCIADCTLSDCGMGERCDPLLGKCLTDLCLNRDCPTGQDCDTEAGKCAGSPCAGWQCPAGLRLNEDLKPPWVTVRVQQDQLPLAGFWCDGGNEVIECATDADCAEAGTACRIRETIVVGLAQKNCMSFKVKNVKLAETLEVNPGFGAGYNNLFVYFAQTPLDNPYAFSIFRASLYQIRFFEGVKEPNVAEIPLDDSDFFPIQEK